MLNVRLDCGPVQVDQANCIAYGWGRYFVPIGLDNAEESEDTVTAFGHLEIMVMAYHGVYRSGLEASVL